LQVRVQTPLSSLGILVPVLRIDVPLPIGVEIVRSAPQTAVGRFASLSMLLPLGFAVLSSLLPSLVEGLALGKTRELKRSFPVGVGGVPWCFFFWVFIAARLSSPLLAWTMDQRIDGGRTLPRNARGGPGFASLYLLTS